MNTYTYYPAHNIDISCQNIVLHDQFDDSIPNTPH